MIRRRNCMKVNYMKMIIAKGVFKMRAAVCVPMLPR